jgi:hypothetical protein
MIVVIVVVRHASRVIWILSAVLQEDCEAGRMGWLLLAQTLLIEAVGLRRARRHWPRQGNERRQNREKKALHSIT